MKTVFRVVLIVVLCVLYTLSVLQVRNVLSNHRQNERDEHYYSNEFFEYKTDDSNDEYSHNLPQQGIEGPLPPKLSIDMYKFIDMYMPKTAEDYHARGLAYLNNSDYDNAIADFTQAIKLNPDYSAEVYFDRGEAYYKRGSAYADKGDYNRAIADYTQAIWLNPNDAETYSRRGSAYVIKGDYDNVITDSTQAIRLNPNDAYAYHWRGFAYDNKGDYDRAIADYETALQLDPKNNLFKLRLENARRVREQLPQQGIEGPIQLPGFKDMGDLYLRMKDLYSKGYMHDLFRRGPWIPVRDRDASNRNVTENQW